MGQTPLRRVVAGHDADGDAVMTDDHLFDPAPIASGNGACARVCSGAGAPLATALHVLVGSAGSGPAHGPDTALAP
jgi:hypothetical protein